MGQRLIDADDLELADFQDFSNKDVFAAIDAQPTVDAVPVVRCRDCKYSCEDISGRCCSHGPCKDWVVLDDSFCGQGERRDDNDGEP